MYSQEPRKIAPPDDVDEYLSRYTKNKVREEAQKQGVDPDLASRQFGQESAYKPDVIKGQRRSSAGAIGTAQLMPNTAKGLGVDPYNIDENISGGVKYMKQQLDTFGGDTRKALAAYNAGPGAVQKAGGVPRFKETQDYVNKIAGPEQKDDVDEFLSRWKEPAQSTESPSPTPPPVSKPSPRVTKNGSPGIFARNQQQRIESTAEARNALNFRPAGGESARMQEQSNRLERRTAFTPKLRAQAEAYQQKSYPAQLAEDVYSGLAQGGQFAQQTGQRAIGAGIGAFNSAVTGGRVKPRVVDIRTAQGQRAQKQTAQQLDEQRRASGDPLAREIASALPAAAGGVLAQNAGGTPGLAAYNVASEDWQNPTRSAVRAAANTVLPIAGARLAKRFVAPVVGDIANPVARTAANVGAEAVGGGVTNAAQTAAEQQIFDGQVDPNAVLRSGIVGAGLGGGMAAAHGPTPSRRAMLEQPNIEQMAARAQDRPGQQGTTITNLEGRGLPTPQQRLERIGQQRADMTANAPRLRTLPQGGGVARRGASADPGLQPQPEVAPVKAPDFRSVADDAKIQASQAEQAGNFGAAAAQYDAARQSLARLRRASAKTADAQTLADLDTEINLANQNKVRAMNAQRAAARQQSKSNVTLNEKPTVSVESKSELQASKPEVQPTHRVAKERIQNPEVTNEPTRDLTAPLLRPEANVNPEGGIPKLPTEPVDFTRLAERQNEQMANEGAKPGKRLITRIAEMGGINMDKHGGEMQSAKDARRVGLLRRKGVSPDLMAQQLRDEGFDVDPNDLNTLWRAIDADVSGQVRPPNTRDLNERLAQEEADYEANRPESEPLPANKNNASVKMMLTRDDHQQLADLGYSREERNAMTPQQGAEIIANGQRKAAIPPNAETEAEIRAAALKRKNPEGYRDSRRGEAQGISAKEEGIVGLTNKKSRTSIEEAAYELDGLNKRLPDGRRFVEDGQIVAKPDEIREYIREHAREKVGGTAELNRRLAQEEADYEANRPAIEEFKSGAPSDESKYISQSDYNKKLHQTYFPEGGEPKSSRTVPQSAEIPPVGSWMMDDGFKALDGREIHQLVEIPVDNIEVSEDTGPQKWGDVKQYAKWLREGKEPPPIRLTQTDKGTLKTMDHRRLMAAKVAGQNKVKAWVSWATKSDREGSPVAGLTYELAQKGHEPIPIKAARDDFKIFPSDAKALDRIKSELAQESEFQPDTSDLRQVAKYGRKPQTGPIDEELPTGQLVRHPQESPFLGADVTDETKVTAKEMGLPSKNWRTPPSRAKEVSKTVNIDDITLGRDDLSKGRLRGAADALKDGIKTGKRIDPIKVVPDPDAPGKYVVSEDGNHRIAVLKLQGFKGEIPVIAREVPTTKAKAAKPAARPVENLDAALRQREALPPQERQEALRQAVPKGQFGKLSEQSYKRGDNAASLVEHPQLRKLLGLGEMPPYHLPDAEINPKTGQPFVNPEWTVEAQKTLNELARLSGKERSSQINFGPGERTPEGKPTRGEMGDLYKSIQKIARSKGERLEPSLDAVFKKTVEGARLNQRGWQEFSVDERTENIRKSLDEIYRGGKLGRPENIAHRDAFREVAAEYGLSKNQADELFAGTKAEARQRAERGGNSSETTAARTGDTAGSQRVVGRSSEGAGTGESVSRRGNAEAPNVAKDTIGNQADIAKKLADITELERYGIYSKKEADAARSKLKFSVGKLEDEPQGPIAAAGLGGLQDIFSRNRRNPDDVELPPIDENLKRTAPPVERGLGTVRLEGKGRVESGPLPLPQAKSPQGFRQFGKAKPVSADEYLNRAIQRPARPALSEGQKAERGAKTVLSRAAKGVQAGTIQDEQRVRITEAADALLKASRSGDAKGIEEANRQLKQAMKSPDELDASTLEKISAARKAFMLSRPVTHLRNIIGNAVFQGAEEIARIPGSAIDTVLSLGTGRRALAGANIFEISKAAGHAIDVTYTAARRGIDAASAKLKGPSEQMGKLQDVKEIHFKNGWLDKGVNGIFKSLDAEDKVFFSAAYGRALHEQAKLTARNSKGAETIDSLLKNPTPEMELNAAMVADVAVFRNKNRISNAIRGAREHLGTKGNFVADMYLPFDKTPTNIILRAIEYSPAGLVGAAGKGVAAAGRGARGAYRGRKEGLPAREVVSKAIDEALPIQQQRRISQLVGRGLVGTALMGLGYGLAASGRMTGYYDEDDPKGEAMKRATGARPLSIRLGGRWYSVSGIAPVGYLLGLGATLHDEMNKKDGNLIGGSAKAMYEMVSEMPMLKTIGDLGKSIKSISKDRGNAGREVGRQVGSFIPGAFDTLGQAVPYVRDPYERETKYPYKAEVSPGRKAVVEGAREIGARIPGARRLLPVKKDALGRPIQTEYLDILDPFSSRPATGPIKRR